MLTDHGALLFAAIPLCIFFLRRIHQIKSVWQAFGNLPSYSLLISPATTIYNIVPRIPWIPGGDGFVWRNSYERQVPPGVYITYPAHDPHIDIFASSKSDVVQLRSLFPFGIPQLVLADATAIKVGPIVCKVIVIVLNLSM